MATAYLPVIALIGLPNVGKSTLFNYLTQSKNALVADWPGLTRDRLYGRGRLGSSPYLLIDTGGLAEPNQGDKGDTGWIGPVKQALFEADVLLMVVDAREGLQVGDTEITYKLRRLGKPLILAVNKSEEMKGEAAAIEFSALGVGTPYPISAAHGTGISVLIERVLAACPVSVGTLEGAVSQGAAVGEVSGIKVALFGRPNVGKSTLLNRILGETRVLVSEQPGTTRDSIYAPLHYRGHAYTLIDTAGVRRKSKVEQGIERLSVIKSLQAIEVCDVAILLLDAQEGVTEQDLHLLRFILEAGRALVIAVNKWDGLLQAQRRRVRSELERRLRFVDFARIHHLSALQGTGVGALFPFVREAYASANPQLSTARLTRWLQAATAAHAPPRARGRAIQLRYAHPGGHAPPLIIIHGRRATATPPAYRRYLEGFYRRALGSVGVPLRIEFRE